MQISDLDKMFLDSKYLIFKKSDYANFVEKFDLNTFQFPIVETHHPERQKEIIFSRLMAHKILNEHFSLNIFDWTNVQDRKTIFPEGIVGSITHGKEDLLVAISYSLQGIGVDLENVSRMKMNTERIVRTADDLLTCPGLTSQMLLTLIFSAKESLYKAINPTVNEFFGFDAAYVDRINVEDGSFVINLYRNFNKPISSLSFKGKFKFFGDLCLSVIEIKSL